MDQSVSTHGVTPGSAPQGVEPSAMVAESDRSPDATGHRDSAIIGVTAAVVAGVTLFLILQNERLDAEATLGRGEFAEVVEWQLPLYLRYWWVTAAVVGLLTGVITRILLAAVNVERELRALRERLEL